MRSLFFIPVAAILAAAPAATRQVGGWTPAEIDREVRAAAAFAYEKIGSPGGGLARLENAGRQIVAGTNYRIDLVLADGKRFQVVVWRKLDGTHELQSAEELPDR